MVKTFGVDDFCRPIWAFAKTFAAVLAFQKAKGLSRIYFGSFDGKAIHTRTRLVNNKRPASAREVLDVEGTVYRVKMDGECGAKRDN